MAAPFAGALTQLSVKRGDPVAGRAAVRAGTRKRGGLAPPVGAAAAGGAGAAGEPEDGQASAGGRNRCRAVAPGSGHARPGGGQSRPSAETLRERLRQRRGDRRCADPGETGRGGRRQLQASVATAKLPARTDEIRAAEADARAAREALAQADWRLGQRAVAAPVAGRVNDTYYVVGDWVPAGLPGDEPAASGQREDPVLRS